MVNQLNKEILDKVDEIVKTIEESSEYQKYLTLKEQIDNNKELKELINEVRILQKDVLHHIEKESKLEEKTTELNNNPLYREYINTLDEINNTFSIIENSLNKYFYDKLNQEGLVMNNEDILYILSNTKFMDWIKKKLNKNYYVDDYDNKFDENDMFYAKK